jgi:hypothetical protein
MHHERFRIYSVADLEEMLSGKGITEVGTTTRPAGILMTECADRVLVAEAPQFHKLDMVYRCKSFHVPVEGPVQAFSSWDRVHVPSRLQSLEFFSKEKGVDTFAIDAHSNCAAMPEGTSDTDQLVKMIESFNNLRDIGGIGHRLIGTFTRIEPGRWKTIVVFDTVLGFPVLEGSKKAFAATESGLLVA